MAFTVPLLACLLLWAFELSQGQDMCACPSEPDNGFTSRCHQLIGTSTEVIYHCNTGYQLRGIASRTCQPNITWTGTAPECFESVCQCQPAPVNGSVAGCQGDDEVGVGGSVTFRCDPGSNVVGSVFSSCLDDLTWSNGPPVCRQYHNCACPPPPTDGGIAGCVGTSNIVSYTCQAGFMVASGAAIRTCRSTGEWSGTVPSCVSSPTGTAGISEETIIIIVVCSCVGLLLVLVFFIVFPLIVYVCCCSGSKQQTHDVPTPSTAGRYDSGPSSTAYPTLRYETGSDNVTTTTAAAPNSYPTLRYD